jgi:ADP-ribose pyrophosphatase YjhB (NUDIX family)
MSIKDRNKAVPASYLVMQRGDEVLLMRRQGSGYYDGWYSLPAGHVDAGELPIAAAIREAKEEIDIVIRPEDVRFLHTTYRMKSDPTGDRADFFFAAKKWGGEIRICEPDKCDDLQWFPIDALPEKTIPYIRQVLQNIREGVPYAEFGVDTTPQA